MASKTLYQWKRSLGWFICSSELATRHGFHAGGRAYGDVDDSRCRILQLDRVPHNFQLGGSRTGTTDANWIRHSEYGHCVGGAILLVVQGAIADRVGLHHPFFLPVICYLFILFYGLSGSKPNSARYARI